MDTPDDELAELLLLAVLLALALCCWPRIPPERLLRYLLDRNRKQNKQMRKKKIKNLKKKSIFKNAARIFFRHPNKQLTGSPLFTTIICFKLVPAGTPDAQVSPPPKTPNVKTREKKGGEGGDLY
jgi:hypothetical protein